MDLRKTADKGGGQQEAVSPVMRFLMSLVSSLLLHSSKPVTAAGFGRDGQEVISGANADGRTGKTHRNWTVDAAHVTFKLFNQLKFFKASVCSNYDISLMINVYLSSQAHLNIIIFRNNM